ncbi:glycosyltransferase family 2 protein [Nocardioides sp. NPDC004968]|uniref:glycosyltransferase family 2 protein n=1 Tax=Nocardioides sp. NPDC004968 TaxID=3155894 RepID=UPI0033B9B6D0
MHASVALVLVSHNGAGWLPTVIDGIRNQQAPVSFAVTIDTGSTDRSVEILEETFAQVVKLPASTTFADAANEALAILHQAAQPPEWIWFLHDDSTPDPHALSTLLDAAAEYPEADILGPKIREWPSLRRMLELGVSISVTGARETGLERGEYDQGQHDEVRRVLAVNTAGMLIRREVLEYLGGFDKHLPVLGTDMDLGWRAANAGFTTIAVPDAVVFHVEAAHRGVRKTQLTGRRIHYQERRAALYTLLVNGRPGTLALWMVRFFFQTLWRMLGFILVRDPGTALDDLAALGWIYGHTGQIMLAKRRRRKQAHADKDVVKALLPPPWLPYRHGLDFVSDVATAVTLQASDIAERRQMAQAEADPASFAAKRQADRAQLEEDEIPAETGWLVRLFTNPVAVLLVVVGILGVIGARAALGGVAGSGLGPTPQNVGDWWQLQFESWHAISQGTGVPAPPHVFPLAVLATFLGGNPSLAVTAVMLLSFPIALGGAWRLLRVAGRLISHLGAPRWLLLWGSTAYALVPYVSGAFGDGRIGAVVVGALLPWLAHAALGFSDPVADRRWRAGWRTGLLLTVITAFAPMAFLVAAVFAAVIFIVARRLMPAVLSDRDQWGPPTAAIATPVGLLLPWWLPALFSGGWAALLLDPGRLPAPAAGGFDLLVGRLTGLDGADLGAPWWLGLALPLLAVLALIPSRTRIPVMVCWIGAVATAVVTMLLSWIPIPLDAGIARVGWGFPLVAIQGFAVVAAVLGAQGAILDGLSGLRKVMVGAAAAAAAVGVVGSLGWFVYAGTGDLTDNTRALGHTGVPSYMLDPTSTTLGPEDGVLVLRGSVDDGIRYAVLRNDGITLGEDEIAQVAGGSEELTGVVRRLAADPDDAVIGDLAAQGVAYIVMPGPADSSVAEGIDASGSVTQASTVERSTRAWLLDSEPSDPGVTKSQSIIRTILLVLAGIGLFVVLVLCLPTLIQRRESA